MDETMDKKRPLSDLMRSTMDKIREMADTNTIVGQPITTPDGVTLIPISRVSMGFGCGGADYGKTQPKDFGGGSGAGVKIEPVAFLVIREGTTRVLPVAMPPMTTLDRVVEMMPDSGGQSGKIFRQEGRKRTRLNGVYYHHQTNEVMAFANPAPAACRFGDRSGGPVQSFSLSDARGQYVCLLRYFDGRGQRPGVV